MARPTNTERIDSLKDEMNDLNGKMNEILNAIQGNNTSTQSETKETHETPAKPVSPQQNIPARAPSSNVPHKDDLNASERMQRAPVEFHLSDDGRYLIAKIDLSSEGYRTDKQIIHGSTGGWKSFTDPHGRQIGLNVMVGQK